MATMRMLAATLILLAWAAAGRADTAVPEDASSITDCVGLLAPGNVYTLTIVVTVDAAKGGPTFTARTDLETARVPDMRAAKAAAEFQDCANRFVSG